MTTHAPSMPLSGPAAPPAVPASPQQHALRRLLLDTLASVGTLDVTDRFAVHACLNLVQRLVAVMDAPLPRLQGLSDELHSAAATTRAGIAAAIYRELALLATSRFGMAPLPLLDD